MFLKIFKNKKKIDVNEEDFLFNTIKKILFFIHGEKLREIVYNYLYN